MSTEREAVRFAANEHPDADQLLLALERELSADEAVDIERHLGICWSCRARSEEMRKGILAFVEYREKRYLPALAEPPNDHRNFQARLREVAQQKAAGGWLTRLWRGLTALSWPGRIGWTGLVAAATAAIFFWVQVVSPPALSAAEFLSRAAAAQNPAPPSETKGAVRRRAHQRVRISTAGQSVIREFDWIAGQPIRQSWNLPADPLAWNAPLTAEGFSAWRDSAILKKDKVERSGDRVTLDTAAQNDPVAEASLTVRAADFHPVGQHLRLADRREIDFEELAFDTTTEPVPARPAAPQNEPTRMPAPFTVQPPLDLNAAELQLRYVMFQQEWDLGEDLAVSASSSKITVSGTASSDDRAAEMRSVLGKLPGVEIAIAGPGDGAPRAGAGKRPRSSSQPVRSSPPLLKDVLDQSFPSRTERLAFVDDCLSSSDLEVSHAWALKRLSDRYNEASVRAWNGELRAKLREMLEVHSEKVGALNHGALDSLQALLPDAQPRKFAAPGDWHQAVLDLFTQVQEQDALVAALVAGTQNGERDLAAAAGRYRSAHRSVGSAADALTSLAGAQR